MMTMVGYPIPTDAEIDAMYEAESARIWEEQNRPADTEMLKLAAKSLKQTVTELDSTLDLVNEAAETLVDTPEGDRVSAILDEMEILLKDLQKMAEDWGKN